MIWLGIGIAAVLIELFTPTALLSIWFAGGALVAGILALFDASLTIQIIVFVLTSLLFMAVIRPIATRYLRGNIVATNADRLIGETGIITKTIEDGHWGEVYVKATYWSAVDVHNRPIEKGSKVKILAIEGAKLIVEQR